VIKTVSCLIIISTK